MTHEFLFATGIENSNPTIHNGRVRVDELEKCGHYQHWRKDFDLVQELGIQFLRYGPPIHTTWLGVGKYDWSFADETFADLRRRNIAPIVDLCHFGVPDWLGNFQNPDFPALFADYAALLPGAFRGCSSTRRSTRCTSAPSSRPCCGWWNEQLTSDRAFVTALKYLVKANVLAMHAILEVRPDAIFIQSESSEYHHAESLTAIKPAEVLNYQRFLSLDLNYGHRVDSGMYEYLLDNGMTRDEYHFFLENKLKQRCVMGNDYYNTNEHRVAADGTVRPSGEVYGYYLITKQYYERYYLPVMHTETNFAQGPNGDEAVQWLWKQWANVLRIRYDGVPIVGFTWYSLTDQVDWDSALRENNGTVNPLGLYDLDRNIRPVGEAYKQIIQRLAARAAHPAPLHPGVPRHARRPPGPAPRRTGPSPCGRAV
ncbi:MAG: glycoside hydrolase family 1 protein [Hymenobacter sp.]